VGDTQNHLRYDTDAVIREGGIGGNHFHQSDVGGAKRDRQYGLDPGGNSKATDIRNQVLNAQLREDLHGRNISRLRKCLADRDGAFELAVIVAWGVGTEADRRIDNRIVRAQSVVYGSRINEGLERRAGLAHRLSDAVELAVVEIISTHHRFYFAGGGLNRQKRRLNLRFLLKADFDFAFRRIHRADHEQRYVARLEDFR